MFYDLVISVIPPQSVKVSKPWICVWKKVTDKQERFYKVTQSLN